MNVKANFKRHKKEQEVIWKFADALWQWREVKEQTDNVDLAIEREFLFDETALATKVTFGNYSFLTRNWVELSVDGLE